MPVVIQEIVITANVDSASPAPTAPGSGGAGGIPTDANARQSLVADCVEEVMRMLREKGER